MFKNNGELGCMLTVVLLIPLVLCGGAYVAGCRAQAELDYACDEGKRAGSEGWPPTVCPYEGYHHRRAWMSGYRAAFRRKS